MNQTVQELNTEMVNICITKACNLNKEDAIWIVADRRS